MRPEERLGTLGYNLREKGRKAGRDGATWPGHKNPSGKRQAEWVVWRDGQERCGQGRVSTFL